MHWLEIKAGRPTRLAMLGALAGVLALVACGGDDDSPEIPQVRAVVNEFATSAGAEACDLLTEEALERVYGGKRRCIERSEQFEGGAVEIESVDISGVRAKVRANSIGRDETFVVDLSKSRPECAQPTGGAWQITDVEKLPGERPG